jgi:hypothetical protein
MRQFFEKLRCSSHVQGKALTAPTSSAISASSISQVLLFVSLKVSSEGPLAGDLLRAEQVREG